MNKYFSGAIAFLATPMIALNAYAEDVINIGDTFTTGPQEAAYVVNEIIEPTSVIASHANEAATEEGKLIPGTKTEEFIKATEMPVYIPLRGQTMQFDGSGQCVAGCQDIR